MAPIAQTDQISKSIRVLAVVDAEEPKRTNVVYVESAPKAGFRKAAKLALMVVSTSCLSRLPDPVGAVVVKMAAIPRWIEFSRPVLRLPFAKAGVVAKGQFDPRFDLPRRPRDNRSAVIAGAVDALRKSRRLFANKLSFECFAHAFARAIVLIASSTCRSTVGGRSIEGLGALRANHIAATSLARVVGNMFSAANLRVASIHVCAALCRIFPSHMIFPENVVRLCIDGEVYTENCRSAVVDMQTDMFAEEA
jgi:hypothetical protein